MLIECSALAGAAIFGVAVAHSRRKRRNLEEQSDEDEDEDDEYKLDDDDNKGEEVVEMTGGDQPEAHTPNETGNTAKAHLEKKAHATSEHHDAAGQLFNYPFGSSIAHPGKTYAMMKNVSNTRLQEFAKSVPADIVRTHVEQLLQYATQLQISNVVAPILNDPDLQPSLVALCQEGMLEPQRVMPIIKNTPVKNIAALLRAPPKVLVSIATRLNTGRFQATLLPILQMPEDFIKICVVPFLRRIEHPEYLGNVLNNVDPAVVLIFLRKTTTSELVNAFDSLVHEDTLPRSHLMQLLSHAAFHRKELLEEKLIPLVTHPDVAKALCVVREVEVERLLHLLWRVNVEDFFRLIENANVEFVIRILNGPLGDLEESMAKMAGGLGFVMRFDLGAKAVQGASDGLNKGITKIKEMRHRGNSGKPYVWVY